MVRNHMLHPDLQALRKCVSKRFGLEPAAFSGSRYLRLLSLGLWNGRMRIGYLLPVDLCKLCVMARRDGRRNRFALRVATPWLECVSPPGYEWGLSDGATRVAQRTICALVNSLLAHATSDASLVFF